MLKQAADSDESGWDTDVEEFFQSKSRISYKNLNLGFKTTHESGWETDVLEYDKSWSRLSSLPKHTNRQSRLPKKSPGPSSPIIQEECFTPRSSEARYSLAKSKSPMLAHGSIHDELTDTEAELNNMKHEDDNVRQKQTTKSLFPAVLKWGITTSDLPPSNMSETTISSNIKAKDLSLDDDEKTTEPLPAKTC